MATTMYAYVQDVAEDWENYERLAAALGGAAPAGLIVHVAGLTGEGFRIIEVWESEEAWERFRSERLRPAARTVAGDGSTERPVFQGLRVGNVVRGDRPAGQCPPVAESPMA